MAMRTPPNSAPTAAPVSVAPPDDAPHSTDALRIAIDQGSGSDKVPFPDPAAAPLGTDDEASGHPPTPRQRAMAAAQELTRPAASPAPNLRLLMLFAFIAALVLLGAILLARA